MPRQQKKSQDQFSQESMENISKKDEELAIRIASLLKQSVVEEVLDCINRRDPLDDSPSKNDSATAAALKQLAETVEGLKNQLTEEIKVMRKECRKEIQELKDSQAFISEKFEELSKRTKILEEESVSNTSRFHVLKLSVDNAQSMHETVAKQVEDIDRKQRLDVLEFHNIPNEMRENTTAIVENVCNLLDINIDENDIVYSHRKFKNTGEKISPILVKFNSRNTRDKIYGARAKLRTASNFMKTKGLSNVFIVENLTDRKRRLFFKAREIKREKGYAFLWSKHGKIFSMKTSSSPVILLENADDFKTMV